MLTSFYVVDRLRRILPAVRTHRLRLTRSGLYANVVVSQHRARDFLLSAMPAARAGRDVVDRLTIYRATDRIVDIVDEGCRVAGDHIISVDVGNGEVTHHLGADEVPAAVTF